jgi:hypothetical protein
VKSLFTDTPHERTPLFNGHIFIVPISEIGNLVYKSLS